MTERNRNERVSRRIFLKASSVAAAAVSATIRAQAATLPFENGERPLVQYPQKRPLLRLTARPPQLETPFEVFKEGIITPNDAFFVRYHLTLSPPSAEQLENFKIQIRGLVKEPLSLSVEQLKREFDQVEVVAVNQCSGNSRGFFKPRVPGGQSGNGMMGNAKWKGVPLKAVLNKVGLQAGARKATFNGMDAPVVPQTPDFIKSLAPALVQAKETGKPIMIDFFATWCPPCKMLDAKTYTDAKVQARSKDWIMVRIDVDQHKALAREYQIASIPTLVLVQPDGKEAARELGFIPPAEMLAFMSKVKPARVDSVPSPTAGNLAPTQPPDQRLSDLP